MRPEVLILQLFRSSVGDTDVKDAPVPGDDLATAEKIAINALEGWFNDDAVPSRRKPTQAQFVGEDGRIVMSFRMEPSGAKKIGSATGYLNEAD